ncbi:hypothetical protein Tco_0316802 [Tanacetum coccineum]
MRSVIAQTRSERASKHSYDSPLPGVNTPGSDEERLEQHELTDNIPPTPYDSPLPRGHTPGSEEGRLQQDKLTDIVTALVKSLEDELKFQKSKSKRRRLTLVISDYEEDLNLETQEGFGDGQEVSTAAQEVSTAVSTASPQRNADTTADDLTLVETLIEIRKSAAKDMGKDKMDETESQRKMKQRVLKMRRVQSFVPMDSELEVQRLKRASQEVLEKPVKRQKTREASGSCEEQSAKKEKELSEEEL